MALTNAGQALELMDAILALAGFCDGFAYFGSGSGAR